MRPVIKTPSAQRRAVTFEDWGLLEYAEAEARQTHYFNRIIAEKKANKTRSTPKPTANYLFFCSHPPVFTLGRNGKSHHLLVNAETLKTKGIGYHACGRGGDITYHGPGQLVVYPVWDLENFFTDIGRYMRALEESVIRTLADYGLVGLRIPALTGVWMAGKPPRKIAALGVRTSQWTCMHGLAFNLNTDLTPYQYITPCGIPNKGITSLAHETNEYVDETKVKAQILNHLKVIFDISALHERPEVPSPKAPQGAQT